MCDTFWACDTKCDTITIKDFFDGQSLINSFSNQSCDDMCHLCHNFTQIYLNIGNLQILGWPGPFDQLY